MDPNDPFDFLLAAKDEPSEANPFIPGQLPGLRPNEEEIACVTRSYSDRTIVKAWLLYFVLSWCGTLGIVFGYAFYLGLTGAMPNDAQSPEYPAQWFEMLGFLIWIPVSLGAFYLSVKLLLPKAE